jgi:hypothetical protein
MILHNLYLGILGWYKTQNYFTVSTPINNMYLISTTCFDLYKSFLTLLSTYTHRNTYFVEDVNTLTTHPRNVPRF